MARRSNGRRLRPDFAETHELREALFAALGERSRFNNVVRQDLRPLWRNATAGDSDNRLFFELRYFAEPPDATESLKAYVAAVDRVVAETLGLTEDGKPAGWAGNYLHALVEPRSGQGTPDPSVPHVPLPPRLRGVWIECAALNLQVSPQEASVSVFGDDGARVTDERISGTAGYGDAEWAQLASHAHELLDEHLKRMRESYEANNRAAGESITPAAEFQYRNPARQHKLPDDMAILLRDRIHSLAIDTPRSAKK